MRLVDLDPKWIAPDTFAFKCPHCQNIRLTCTLEKVSHDEQWDAAAAHYEDDGRSFVLCNPDQSWTATTRDFATMSVTPSLDASASGHWHGHITNGAIT